jgi:hypothetical protein
MCPKVVDPTPTCERCESTVHPLSVAEVNEIDDTDDRGTLWDK